MKKLQSSTKIRGFGLCMLILFLSPSSQARSHEGFTTDVPFKFNVGERTFRPGHYEFIFAGSGLVALRDGQKKIVASFVTRSIAAAKPASASKLVFSNRKKRQHLIQIWIENRAEGVEIIGEELAFRSIPPQPITVVPGGMCFSSGRPDGFRLTN